jgi:predicted PurR-regulated permease PerM
MPRNPPAHQASSIETDPSPRPAALPPRTVARLTATIAATAGGLYLVYEVRDVLKLLVLAGFTAAALGPLVDTVQRLKLNRATAIVAVYLAGVLVVAGIGTLVAPSIGTQAGRVSQQVGDLRENATVRRYDDRYHLTEKAQAQLAHLPSTLKDLTVSTFGVITDTIAVLSIAFLLILHGEHYSRAAIDLLPEASAQRWRALAPRIYRAVYGSVLGNLQISAVAGTAAWLAMTALQIPFAVPLALAVAFFDLIPMVGATLGSILVALVALLVSPLTAVLWLVYSFLYQQAENYVIRPAVYRRVVQVSALGTIVAVLIGGTLLGLVGALLAIPAAAAIQIVLEDRYDRRTWVWPAS